MDNPEDDAIVSEVSAQPAQSSSILENQQLEPIKVMYGYTACHHKLDDTSSSTDNLTIHPEYFYADDKIPVLLITQPRWCLECIADRTKAICKSFAQRLAPRSSEAQDIDTEMQLAFVRGVRDGRIFALTRPLYEAAELRADEERRTDSEEAAELLCMMEGFGLGSIHDSDAPLPAKLLEFFNRCSLRKRQEIELDDELVRNLEIWFAKEEAYTEGTVSGRLCRRRWKDRHWIFSMRVRGKLV